MEKIKAFVNKHTRWILCLAAAGALLIFILSYKLGSLSGGLSSGEVQAAAAAVGWHGIFHQPLYLPLKLLRSVVFYLYPAHGQTLTRLPNALFGGLSIVSFIWLIRLWHSNRITIFTGLLFATSAWTLHVSRLASFDVMYLWATITMLLVNVLIYRYSDKVYVWCLGLAALGLILYIPGLIWLELINLYFLKTEIFEAFREFKALKEFTPIVLSGLIWLPLLIIDLFRPGQLVQWLGLPAHLAPLKTLAKQFIGVPVHLFIRGPLIPQLWLGKAPLMDIFTLIACLIGIYFYLTHLKAVRSQLLISLFIASWILVALNGPVGLSTLVPIIYVAVAAGLTFLLHKWLSVFPLNPLARGLGIGLISIAVCLACFYNLRAYFVAWQYNPTARVTFHYRR